MTNWDRLSLRPIVRAHLKGLTIDGNSAIKPDWVARVALILPTIGLAVAAYLLDWSLPAATSILAGVALLAGGTLSAFSALSTLRLRLTDSSDDEEDPTDRDALDESVAHLLTVTMLCVIDAILIVVGMNAAATHPAGGIGVGWLAAAVIGVSTYLALLFLMVIPRLYYAYTLINKVRVEMSGYAKLKGPR